MGCENSNAVNNVDDPSKQKPIIVVDNIDMDIFQLKTQRDKFNARIRELSGQIDVLKKKVVQQNKNNHRNLALESSKQVLILQKQQTVVAGYYTYLHGMIIQIEGNKDSIALAKCMKRTNKVLEIMNQDVNLKNLDRIVSDLSDNLADVEEFNHAFDSLKQDTNDAAAQAEFDRLMNEDSGANPAEVQQALDAHPVPQGPIQAPVSQVSAEEEAMVNDVLAG